ncbi:MAG: MBL fold metallo-hydrolase [Bacteroidota bacterium]
MKATVTYIYHNCFILKESSRTFLFDYPDDRFLTAKMREVVTNELRGSKVFIFASHSHQDHFNPKLMELAKVASQSTFILSEDIIKKHPRFGKSENCVIVRPSEAYELEKIRIKSFPSNDLGVAYLIQNEGLTVYFGGDLAKWSWDDFTPEERRWMEERFQNTIEALAQHQIDLAFENTDPRLPNWAGAAEFIQIVKPKLFVPMHTFGDLDSLGRFMKDLGPTKSKIFQYRKTGDQIDF